MERDSKQEKQQQLVSKYFAKDASKAVIKRETLHEFVKQAWTALLLKTEMSILKADKMSPLFQEVIVASSMAKFQKNGCQMKDMDIIFPLTPHEHVWVY